MQSCINDFVLNHPKIFNQKCKPERVPTRARYVGTSLLKIMFFVTSENLIMLRKYFS